MTDPRKVLDEIALRADAATPGPWWVADGNEGHEAGPLWMVVNDAFLNPPADPDVPWIAAEVRIGIQWDAEFIAHARTDVPTLVAALRAVLDITDGQHEYTCEASWVVRQIRNAITEALGGAQ
jgi:hypothetical protein